MGFIINGDLWNVAFVDPMDERLVDRTGNNRLATTDPYRMEICLSNELNGDMLSTVLTHELCHATLVSYGLLDELHDMVYPDDEVKAEEWICNLIADHGDEMLTVSQRILKGDNRPKIVPLREIA